MYMLVKIGHFVITTQLSGSPVSYLSQQLGNCLISVKRLFDKFIVSKHFGHLVEVHLFSYFSGFKIVVKANSDPAYSKQM